MNYTSIEQSKKLLSLGFSPESADMFYSIIKSITTGEEVIGRIPMLKWDGIDSLTYIPCWSVGALIDLMPRVENNYPIMFRANNFKLTYSDKEGYCIHLETGSLLDVCYNMMVWLLENDYIKKGE